MSLLVEVRNEPMIVNGELVKPGEKCRLPNSLALALNRKGACALASGPEIVKAHEETKARKRAARKAKVVKD